MTRHRPALRTSLALAVIMTIAGCGARPTATTPQAPTQQEVELFCTQYEQVKHLSRTEMLQALIEYAPAAIAGPVKRASELGGSPEDDVAIDEVIDACRADG